jgi:Tol biopolymer transport system component
MSLLAVASGASKPLPVLGQAPSFSPDGSHLALSFTNPGRPTAATYVGGLESLTGGLTKVSAAGGYETAPQWLRDGSIAYIAASDRWEVRLGGQGQADARTLAQAPSGFVISDLAVSPDGTWFAYTLQSTTELHRFVHIASAQDPSVGLDLPQDRPWNDRVLGWVPGTA